jgi:hypothetical protein
MVFRVIPLSTSSAIVVAALIGAGCAPSAPVQAPEGRDSASQATPVPSARVAAPQSNVIYISREMAYSDPRSIDRNVLSECSLPSQGAELLEDAARDEGFKVLRDDQAVKAGKGRVLQIEIINAVSGGNPFLGHFKRVDIKGQLLEDGKEIGSFRGYRTSRGGAFGGFKGSCSVLGRCLKTLSKDVTSWLKTPGKDSRIGE